MSPGLTSAGGKMDDEVEEGEIVAIYAESKTHALAIGITLMSASKMYYFHNLYLTH